MGVSRVTFSTENKYPYKNSMDILLLCVRDSVVGKARLATGWTVRISTPDLRYSVLSWLQPVQTALSGVQHPSTGTEALRGG